MVLDALQAANGASSPGRSPSSRGRGRHRRSCRWRRWPATPPITLTQAATRDQVRVGQTATCSVTATNTLPVKAKVEPADTVADARPVGDPARAQEAVRGKLVGHVQSGARSYDHEHRPSTRGTSPGGGYLPLSPSAWRPIAGWATRSIVNFSAPAFQWGERDLRQDRRRLNGYVVVGGGSSDDNVCCNPQIPNTSPPNNLIAPFWTDLSLDPSSGGGAIRVATLTDRTTGMKWLVVDYDQVRSYGSTVADSFEVWVQLGDTEGVWLSYGTMGGANGNPLAVGAENRDGTSGISLGAVSSDTEYQVLTGPPTPGGVAAYAVTFRALFPGDNRVATSLRSGASARSRSRSTRLRSPADPESTSQGGFADDLDGKPGESDVILTFPSANQGPDPGTRARRPSCRARESKAGAGQALTPRRA